MALNFGNIGHLGVLTRGTPSSSCKPTCWPRLTTFPRGCEELWTRLVNGEAALRMQPAGRCPLIPSGRSSWCECCIGIVGSGSGTCWMLRVFRAMEDWMPGDSRKMRFVGSARRIGRRSSRQRPRPTRSTRCWSEGQSSALRSRANIRITPRRSVGTSSATRSTEPDTCTLMRQFPGGGYDHGRGVPVAFRLGRSATLVANGRFLPGTFSPDATLCDM